MLVPIVVILIPGIRLIPGLYRWRITRRIYPHNGELMALERAALAPALSAEERTALLARLDDIENNVIADKIPGSFADQTYVLREHICFVRERLQKPD